MTTIAGLDLSLVSTGVALLEHDAFTCPQPIITARTVGRPGRRSDSYRARSARIVQQVRAVVSLVPAGVDLVVLEGPAYGQHMPSTHDRAGLWWGVFSALTARKTPVAVCPPQTRAKYATGKGNADKAMVVDAVREMWPRLDVRGHDEADGVVLVSIGAHRLGVPLPYPTRDRHAFAVEAVAWPEGLSADLSAATVLGGHSHAGGRNTPGGFR